MELITFHALNEHSRFPEKAHESDAGWDVFFTGINHSDLIPTEHEFILLQPHQIAVLGTGICANIPVGNEIQVRSRSGWASKGLIVVNGIGTIDANYRGEIRVIVSNVSNSIVQIPKGSKIAQLVPCKLDNFMIQFTHEPIEQNTDRGVSGFGDSDKKQLTGFEFLNDIPFIKWNVFVDKQGVNNIKIKSLDKDKVVFNLLEYVSNPCFDDEYLFQNMHILILPYFGLRNIKFSNDKETIEFELMNKAMLKYKYKVFIYIC